jgi:prophage DNA circulation protein
MSEFDASLPKLPEAYGESWRKAYRAGAAESPRTASYQAPGGEAVPFIQKSFRFSGGQAQDTAEYPFGGLWSNEYLNEKPQILTVEGFLRGPSYIAQRNKLVEALRVPTNDDNPGYIDLPFWGRFPVAVGGKYEVSEDSDEQGQCKVSIVFTRAGASAAGRAGNAGDDAAGRKGALPPPEEHLEKAKKNLEDNAVEEFEKKLPEAKIDKVTLAAAMGQLKTELLSILGRIQGAQTLLNNATAEIQGITSLINQGIRAPRELAQALLNAGASIVSGIQEIKNSIAMYGKTGNLVSFIGSSGGAADGGASRAGTSAAPSLPSPDNEKNVLILFLSASTYTLPVEAATASQEAARAATENLYRITALLASARILAGMDSLTYKKAGGYWRLLEKLAGSIGQEDPGIYAAVRDLRTALSRKISSRDLSGEMTRKVSAAAPLLYLAYYLGCGEEKIRELNSVADSFIVDGEVIYV